MSDTTIYKSIIQKDESATEISDTTNNQSKQDEKKQEKSKTTDISKTTQRNVIKENQNIKWRI